MESSTGRQLLLGDPSLFSETPDSRAEDPATVSCVERSRSTQVEQNGTVLATMRLQTMSSAEESVIQIPAEVAVKRSDPIYNAHAYLTKVPVAAIEPFIKAFSESGDVVLDIYAGSGM